MGALDAGTFTGLSKAPGAHHVAQTLTVNAPLNLPGVKLAANSIAVSSSFTTAGLGSFQLTGGNLNVTNNSTFNLTQGTSSVANLNINTGDSSSLVVSGSSTSLTAANTVDLNGNIPALIIQNGNVSLQGGARAGHDGQGGRILVSGGTVNLGNIQLGFNGGVASLVVSNGELLHPRGNHGRYGLAVQHPGRSHQLHAECEQLRPWRREHRI